MAEDAPSALGDFFAKKKKKVKASNLNVAPAAKTEETKKKKDADEQGWQEEEVVAPTLNIQAVGNLGREEEKKDDEEDKMAWGAIKSKASAVTDVKQQNRFPTLAKSTRLNNTNINIDDGSNGVVNIATNKNAFSALDGDDEDGPKRPREIKPAMVTKVKGEFETTALKREVDKHTKTKKKKKAKADSDDETEYETEEEEEAEEQAAAPVRREKKKKVVEEKAEEPEEAEEDKAEDLKIKPDDEEKAYEIEVDKSAGEVFLGVTWKVTSTGFEIQTLDDDGLIAKWNKENEDEVAVYDMIVAVNDEGEADEMREELKKAQKLEIELVRASAIKSKYKGRRRLPPVKLPAEELRDPSKEKPKAQVPAGGKKKKGIANFEEDDKKKKLQYIED